MFGNLCLTLWHLLRTVSLRETPQRHQPLAEAVREDYVQ